MFSRAGVAWRWQFLSSGMFRTALIASFSAAFLAGCCGAVPCAGIEAGGICWMGRAGVTVSQARASRVYEIARKFWGQKDALDGWTVEFGIEPIVHVDHGASGASESHVVDGLQYFGWDCPQRRLIIVQPFAAADSSRRVFPDARGHGRDGMAWLPGTAHRRPGVNRIRL